MERDVKKLILLAICGLMALMTILGLIFNVIYMSFNGKIDGATSGFNLLAFDQNELLEDSNGFIIFSGILNMFILFSGVCATIMVFIAFLDNSRSMLSQKIIPIALVSSIAYLLEGIIFKILCKKEWAEIGLEDYTRYFHTASFIPFIIQSILLMAYNGCKKHLPCIPIKSRSAVNIDIVQSNEIRNLSDKATLLKQYKDLLDNGVITQEEFDLKKKELL